MSNLTTPSNDQLMSRYKDLISKKSGFENQKIVVQTRIESNTQQLKTTVNELQEKFAVSTIEEAEVLLSTKKTDFDSKLSDMEKKISKFNGISGEEVATLSEDHEIDGI